MTNSRLPSDDRPPEALLRALDRLPHEIEPAADRWATIRSRIEAARVVPLGASVVPARPNRWWLAAAAAVLVVSSSAVTMLVIRSGAPADMVSTAPPAADAPPQNASVAPRAAAAAWASYDAAAEDLERVLQARRAQLSPATVRAVEESLRVIDGAIAEARAALERDPASRDLMEVLDSVYRQKLDLLRRANDLPLRSS